MLVWKHGVLQFGEEIILTSPHHSALNYVIVLQDEYDFDYLIQTLVTISSKFQQHHRRFQEGESYVSFSYVDQTLFVDFQQFLGVS